MINSTPAGERASTRGPARPAGDAVLTISEVSQRTGIPPAGLRNWEQRYGLPSPQRSPSGQRRYTEADCALLSDVLRLRESGLSIPAAVAQAATAVSASAGRDARNSIFAGLRHSHPGLQVHVLAKTALLALTLAIEDETCARAQRPVLIGAFQQQRYYQSARRRWADLARSAEQTIAFADFPHSRQGQLAEISVPGGSPLRREWALICDAPDHPACVAGWERPGQDAGRDRDRVFETVWSADPQVVRTAARIGTALAAAAIPELAGQLEARLSPDPGPASADLRRASGLLERTLDYLAGAAETGAPSPSGPAS